MSGVTESVTNIHSLILSCQRESDSLKRNRIFSRWLNTFHPNGSGNYYLSGHFNKCDDLLQTKLRNAILARIMKIDEPSQGILFPIMAEMIKDALDNEMIVDPNDDGQNF